MRNVFEPWSLGTLRLRNRIIRSATHEDMAHPDGMPTDDLVTTYERLAAGGVGAIITGPNQGEMGEVQFRDAHCSHNESWDAH